MANITSWTDLKNIANDLTEDYILTADLSSADGDYSSAGGDAWTAIGTVATPFTGTFNGDGHTISDLTMDVNLSGGGGLFGVADGAVISNIGLIDCDVTQSNNIGGGLVG